ncbi:MAG: hypothetical protein QW815_08005 [Nitrososphaerota archaeon]
MGELKSWKELPIGGRIVKPGSSLEYKTGSWRTFKPVIDMQKCNRCMICFVYCPDGCINPEDYGVKYEYCKGCGICAHECPLRCIQMVEEVV